MAVQRKRREELPPDAVILTEDEALQYQLDIIKNWKKKADTWVFKHGYSILAGMSALTGMYLNNHYRTKFKLREFGRFSSYLPCVMMPALISTVFHQQFVLRDVILQNKCPVCVQTRAASIQCLTGCIFPAILAPLASMPFAIRYLTYNVPAITTHPKQVYQLMYKFTKPIGNTILLILAVQGLVAASLTYQEQKSFLKIQLKLNEIEQKLEAEYGNEMKY